MKKESPLRSSISLLIGIVIAILALVRGRMLLPLLLAVLALWLLWWLLTQALPLWRNNRAYRAKEARLREQTAAAKDGGQLADALLCHVNYRITAMLHAAYPNARWEWLADKPSRFAVEGGTARIRVYGIPDFDYADVKLDQKANLDCSLVKLSPLVTGASDTQPPNRQPVNPRVWFETRGRAVLEALVTDLNSRGHSSLTVQENGEVFVQAKENEAKPAKETFLDFPEKVYWPQLVKVLEEEGYWDAQNHAYIHLNPLQSHDVNLTLQKRYAFLQWEQGSGKTPAAIFTGKHRVEMGAVHSIWVISSAISIRNNWDVILKGAGFSYVFVERLADLQRIRPGDFVILTLNKVSQYKKQIGRYIKQLGYKIQFIFDESDNISNPSSKQTLSVLSCFRRCKYKLLTTGTSTRNNISEFAPQLELLYNNSINMISWCRTLYSYDKRSADMEHKENPYYAMPIPAYKKGYRLFANSHLPEKITVFGVGQRNQDIYNADELDRLLGKTVITRTFEEVTGKDIRRIHQMPIPFLPEEREVYNIVLKEFYRIQREYYSSTGNSRKDALMRLIQQITLLLRISAAPDCMKEYEGETPLKEMAVVEALARWPEEVVAIGVRHTTVLDRYAAAIREYLPERPLFVVTGSTVTFAKRRALRDVLRDSQNGILLCTQQSLPSSVNFEFVNKIIIPEMHYNNAGMSQFYMRFVRYTSTEKKDLYFPIYIGSLESNLMQMVLAKEKLTMFMKGQDADMDEIYAKFGVDYDLLSTLMTRETDDEGHLRIHWGEQKIA